jgi:hypothetical protein
VTWLVVAVVLVAVDVPVLWVARRRPRVSRWRGVEARWLRVTWRVGLVPGEWWVGARRDCAEGTWWVCPLPGVVLVVGWESQVGPERDAVRSSRGTSD